MEKINPVMTIEEILKNYPQTFDVFVANGFNVASREELLELAGNDTMIQSILKVRGINVDIFINALREKVFTKGLDEDLVDKFHDENSTLNLLGKIPCPLRILFKDMLGEAIKDYKEKTGITLNCYIPSGCGDKYEYEDICSLENIDELPDIILTKGFDDFHRKNFIDKFVKKGYFKSVFTDNLDDRFLEAGCLDNDYTMYASFLDVMLIDEKNLGDLPKPKTWSDLLNPIYKDKIITFGMPEGISTVTPIYLYKEHGVESIAKFAHNVKGAYHGAKMAKVAGTNSKEAGAIYILPLFFAKTCIREGLSILWPEDGAILYPFCMLVKESKMEEMKYLIDFITKDFGQVCAKSHGIALNPDIKNTNIPKDGKLKWIGWNYIKSKDVIELGDYIRKEFEIEWQKKNSSEDKRIV
ncbi:putative Fe3+ ABC transporter periplasmic binding-like protein [Gottschalkia purinilytica]|uniref:Putative Fe3+ ABC transporter periplasmic binding-like protein n=1 Tax=Gottschalkia purinilytica TaxID=1503 RepID=A0A0L0WBG0_GOTPU|nr:ABC transporter substrate-binding protein [Gottschalkia purinilytica]KNF08680.1 putative Fe3+ ABC transporter periplasmic binding-like protein [Gottschalkia purinilytica]